MSARNTGGGFSIERAAIVLRNRIMEEAPSLGIGLAVVVGINALTFLASRVFVFNHDNGAMWALAIVISGLLLCAQAFKAMHDGKAGTDWLLLPASPLEKFSAAVVDYVILFPIAAALAATGLSALFHVIAQAASKIPSPIWTFWNVDVLKGWAFYAVAATVFIAGSASFRKIPFLKTSAMAMAYTFVLGILLTLGVWIVVRSHGNIDAGFHFENFNFETEDMPKSLEAVTLWVGRIAWFVVLPAFSLVYGYFRVFEKEARDEVQ